MQGQRHDETSTKIIDALHVAGMLGFTWLAVVGGCGWRDQVNQGGQDPLPYHVENDGVNCAAAYLANISDREQARGFLLDLLERTCGKAPFAEIIAGPDEQELKKSIIGTPINAEAEPSFNRTRELLWEGGRLPSREIARVIRIGSGILLSYREPGVRNYRRPGVLEELVKEPDPTKVGPIRILAIRIVYPGSLAVAAKGYAPADVNCRACEDLGLYLKGLAPLKALSICMREDTWFANQRFPLYSALNRTTPRGYTERWDRRLWCLTSPRITGSVVTFSVTSKRS